MTLLMLFATVWGIAQLAVLSGVTRSVRFTTLLVAMAAGVYGCALAALLVELGWTRMVASATGASLPGLVQTASYTVDPVVEELAKVAPLLLLGWWLRRRRQWGFTDYLVLGAALGAGFGLTEAVLRFGAQTGIGIGAMRIPGGYLLPGGLLTPVYIPSIGASMGGWLPEPTTTVASPLGLSPGTNLHLVYSLLAGLGIGVLLRVRGPRRLLGFLLVGFAAASHAAYNHATIITPKPRTVDALFWPLDQVNHVLWLVPLLCLGLSTWLDLGRLRQGKAELAGVVAGGERSGGLGLWSYATLRPPWTTLVTLHFLRVRRALCYTRSTTEAAPLLEGVRELRRRIDETRSPDAWRDRSWPPLVPPTRRLVLVAIWLLLLAPGALYLLIGGWPSTASLQKFLGSPHVFPVLAALTTAGIAWSLWRLLSMLRSLPAAVALPYAEPAARLQLQAIAGVSAVLFSAVSLYKWFTGTAPTARIVESFHILQAQWPLIIGLSIAILGLMLFPPAGWFATMALAEGMTTTVLTTEGLAGVLTESAAITMMAAAAQGGGETGGGETGAQPQDEAGSIDESERTFSPEERRTAELLKSEGKSVRALPESTEPGVRTPDAEVDGQPTEFKHLDPGAQSNTVNNSLSRAKGQADQAILDARGSGLGQADAQAGLEKFLRIWPDRMSSIRIVGDGFDIAWP